jgi:tetratricopeptide (TPR) repeat protein
MLAFQPTFSAEAARDLIGQETGFGEVHLLLGQRAFLNGNLPSAFRDLTRARELLPDSVSVNFALANITFAYARYADALALYDRVLASAASTGLEAQVKLGRAKSLSYLKRHDEALALLTDVLQNDASNNPGEKYYWRAWNRLQLGQAQLAYNDATTGLNVMRNDAIYRLVGMASFSLSRLDESRVLRRGAEDEPRRLRLRAVPRVAQYGGAQLEAGIEPILGGGVVLRSGHHAYAEGARGIREGYYRPVQWPHRR